MTGQLDEVYSLIMNDAAKQKSLARPNSKVVFLPGPGLQHQASTDSSASPFLVPSSLQHQASTDSVSAARLHQHARLQHQASTDSVSAARLHQHAHLQHQASTDSVSAARLQQHARLQHQGSITSASAGRLHQHMRLQHQASVDSAATSTCSDPASDFTNTSADTVKPEASQDKSAGDGSAPTAGDDKSEDKAEEGRGDGLPPSKKRKAVDDAKKRSAAASHVVTEQLRRDRINECFATLRHLVPHTKSDKAAFLQEVINHIQLLHTALSYTMQGPGAADAPGLAALGSLPVSLLSSQAGSWSSSAEQISLASPPASGVSPGLQAQIDGGSCGMQSGAYSGHSASWQVPGGMPMVADWRTAALGNAGHAVGASPNVARPEPSRVSPGPGAVGGAPDQVFKANAAPVACGGRADLAGPKPLVAMQGGFSVGTTGNMDPLLPARSPAPSEQMMPQVGPSAMQHGLKFVGRHGSLDMTALASSASHMASSQPMRTVSAPGALAAAMASVHGLSDPLGNGLRDARPASNSGMLPMNYVTQGGLGGLMLPPGAGNAWSSHLDLLSQGKAGPDELLGDHLGDMAASNSAEMHMLAAAGMLQQQRF